MKEFIIHFKFGYLHNITLPKLFLSVSKKESKLVIIYQFILN